jgi:hypothetical protein
MPALLPLALGVAAVGTGYSIYAGERANKQAKKAAQAEQARNDLRAARERRDAVRQARMAYGMAAQSAENQGVGESSSAIGGQASISSQLSSNLSFLDKDKFYADQASTALGNMRSWSNRANTASQVAGLAMTAFNNSEAITNQFNKIFKGS